MFTGGEHEQGTRNTRKAGTTHHVIGVWVLFREELAGSKCKRGDGNQSAGSGHDAFPNWIAIVVVLLQRSPPVSFSNS